LLPVTTLLGGLMGLGAMANHQELIAARVAGMSKRRLARPVVTLAVFLALLVVLVQTFVVPPSERLADELRARALEQTNFAAAGRSEFWARSGDQYVQIADVVNNQSVAGVEIYRTAPDGTLQEIVQARTGRVLADRRWRLTDVTVTRPGDPDIPEVRHATLELPMQLTEEQAEVLTLPIEALSPRDLSRMIDYLAANQQDTHRPRVVFWQQISNLVALVAMALLALPLLVGSTRSIPASQRIVFGGAIGIAFYLLQQLTAHTAALFQLNPPLTIMAPAMVLLVLAVIAQNWERAGS
jgi:lipopolysaccharide export system permease protein